MKRKSILPGLLAGGLMLMTVGSASALPIEFVASGGSGDTAVNAQADFTLSNGSLTLTLTDLQQNPRSAGELISGISFDIGGASGSFNLASSSGILSTIASGGSYATGSPSSLSRWHAGLTGTQVSLTAIGGGQPSQLIIGPDDLGKLDGSGKYSNLNASGYNFNPMVLGTATFVFSIDGVNGSSKISNVQFAFGTGPDTYLPGTSKNVPDGGSTALLLGAALSVLGLIRRKLC